MNKASRHSAGFTLLELLVSIAIFTIVGGVGLGLVASSTPLYNRQQNATSLNIGLRGAVAQMEQDAVNAGTGYYVGINFPDWPVGVTITKAPSGTCYDATAHTYGDPCFDTLNVVSTDMTTPPANLSLAADSSLTTVAIHTPTSSNPATGAAWTAAEYAAKFLTGDQVLLLNSTGSQMTTFHLTANATVVTAAPPVILLTHTATNANGTNGTNAGGSAVACTQTTPPANDYLGITMCWNSKVGNSFVGANDWVLKLSSVTYKVDTTDTTNPKLVRRAGPPGATTATVTDQVIGFKVGAALWNSGNGTDTYTFDPALYPNMSSNPWDGGYDPYNYTRVRSIRVSLIGRTTPNPDPTYTFRNTFDSGPYQIQSASVVVNPRNLSMKD
jgi:prepilin-type N-terminal cleavage/methylation domain-containing protein